MRGRPLDVRDRLCSCVCQGHFPFPFSYLAYVFEIIHLLPFLEVIFEKYPTHQSSPLTNRSQLQP